MSFLKEYTLLGELGTGGFAKVYKVRHNTLGYIRAIRVLNEPVTNENSRTYQKFLRECKVLLRLGNGNHRNIVHIYQPRLLENHALVEMDYVDGKDISHYLNENGNFLPIDEVLRMVEEISSALAYCHEDIYKFCMDPDDDQLESDPIDGSKWIVDDVTRKKLIEKYKVIHNDIHSGNIMRREDGSFVLLDFGLAITGEDDVRNSSRHENGAIEFKAPEKWDNEALLTEQSDIYSFGVVMYEYLAGRVPFSFDKRYSNAEATFKLCKEHKEQMPPKTFDLRKSYYEAKFPGNTYEKDYPDWLEEAVMKCLEKKPENRFKNGKDLHDYITESIKNDAIKSKKEQIRLAEEKGRALQVLESTTQEPMDCFSQKNPPKRVWPWMVATGVAIIVLLGVLLHKSPEKPQQQLHIDSGMLHSPNHDILAENPNKSWQQQCIDSIEMLVQENEKLYRKVSIEPYDCKKIQLYDLQSYKRWLPIMDSISKNFWAAYRLSCLLYDSMPQLVHNYYDYSNRNSELWSIGFDYCRDLHDKELDNYETLTDSTAKEEAKKRMELIEQCGLLYPD